MRAAARTSRGETNGLRIYLSDAVYLALSSTELRQRVRDGLGIRYRVTPEVDRYIKLA